MYVNILNTNANNFKLAGYISDSGKEVYIEMLGITYGHLLLMDTIDSLKVLRREEDPWKRLIHRIPGWYKFEIKLGDISETPRVGIYDDTLGTEETKFLEDAANQHIIKLYQYLQKNPWVRISDTDPVWNGNTIINITIPKDFHYQESYNANLANFDEFEIENYRFDDGSPLPICRYRMVDYYELVDEHEGDDKTFVLQS